MRKIGAATNDVLGWLRQTPWSYLLGVAFFLLTAGTLLRMLFAAVAQP